MNGVQTRMGAAEMARAVASKKTSAVDLVHAHLEALERSHAPFNAVVTVCADQAVQAAHAVDAQVARGELVGPLAGVPITVKDVLCTAGVRATAGAPWLAGHVPVTSAPAVQACLDAGAVLLGKSNTPAFAADVQCNSPLLGRANNPYNPAMTTGGSTGGGACAVSLGVSALDLGSDHGGSLRVPAAFCGVVGFKPTVGVLNNAGHLHPTAGLQGQTVPIMCVGPVGRCVEDVALAAHVMSRGGIGLPSPGELPQPPRLAFLHEVEGMPMDAACARVVHDVERAVTAQGWSAVAVAMPPALWADAWAAWQVLIGEAVTVGALRNRSAQMKAAGVNRWLEQALNGVDAWVTPTTLLPPFPHVATGTPLKVDGKTVDYWLGVGGVTCVANITGRPAISLPAGLGPDGLPRAVHLMGHVGGDAALLDVAYRLERFLPPRPWPRLPA